MSDDARHTKAIKTSRRKFINSAIAMTAGAQAVTLLPKQATASGPVRGGHLKMGVGQGQTSDTLELGNPSIGTFTILLRGTIRNMLVELNPNGEPTPSLATSWDSSPDAAVWTFELRKGVEFHNGKSLTPQDVVDSINVHRGEDTKSGGKSLISQVTDIKVDGPDKVRFELEAGNADFPYYLTQYFFQIAPSVDGVVDKTSGIGTGPFILESFDPGVRALVKRNPNYFMEGRPYLDSAEIIAITDSVARSNALVSGQVDVIDQVDIKTVPLLAKVDGVNVETVKTGAHYSMPMNTTVAPFSDVNVRLALKYSVDRELLVKQVFGGLSDIGNDNPISPNSPFFNSELPQRTFDPERAKFHLAKSGLSSLAVSLDSSDGAWQGSPDAAILFKQSAKQAGIDVTVSRQPADGYWSNVWMKSPFCYGQWQSRPTPDLMFSLVYKSGANWNESYWSNDRFDKLLLAARSELDFARRRDMYWEMQELIHNDGGTIIPAFKPYVYGFSDKVGHGKIAGDHTWDGGRAAERWWKT